MADNTDDNEFDTDLGFDDNNESQPARSNALLKIGLVAVGVVAVVGGLMMFGGTATKVPPSQVGGASPDNTAGDPNAQPTPEYTQAVQNYNQQVIEQAKQTGTSAIGINVDPLRNPLLTEVKPDKTSEDEAAERFRQAQEQYQSQQEMVEAQRLAEQQAQARAAAVQDMSQSMSSYLTNALSTREAAGSYEVSVGYASPTDETTGTLNGSSNSTSADGTTTPSAKARVIIPATTIEYGQLLIEANTDAPGPVLAMMVSGKFSGARLLGSFQKTDEYLTLNFNQLVTKDGKTVPIQAIALDPKTTLPGLVTEIDRKYIQRIIVPAAAEFISGVGQAIAQTKQTTTQNSSSTETSNDDPDFNEAMAQGITRGFDSISETLRKDAGDKQIMLRIAAGTPIGILFTQEVLDPDDAAAARAAAAQEQTATPAGQIQQLVPQGVTAAIPGFYVPATTTGNPYVQPTATAPAIPSLLPTTATTTPATSTSPGK